MAEAGKEACCITNPKPGKYFVGAQKDRISKRILQTMVSVVPLS